MMSLAIETVDSMVIKRQSSSKPKHKQKQNLCVDKAYHFQRNRTRNCEERIYSTHIRHRREEERIFHRKHPARRWVVERTNSWHNNRFRKLFTRYEKKDENYLTLVKLANCIIIYRRIILG